MVAAMKKRLFALLLCCALVVGLGCPALAADQRVFDYSNVIDTADEAALEEAIAAQREETGIDWIILTIDDAEGSTSRQVADSFFLSDEDFGTGSDRSGVLFLIDFDNGEIYICTHGKGIDYITDSRREAIFDRCFDQVVEGEYYDAAITFLEEGRSYVAQGVPKDHYYEDEETGEITQYRAPLSPFTVVLFALAAAAIALVFRFGVTRGYSIKSSAYAYPFMSKSSLAQLSKEDTFRHRNVTTRHIPRKTDNGGGGGGGFSSSGGGSRVHSSGGSSFGGGGRKFK